MPKGNAPPEDDRLYVCDARTGKLAPFHALAGADPSVAADTGEVVFRRLTTLKETADGPLVHEDLPLFDLRTGALATITNSDCVIHAAGNLYEQPAVSPDGRLVLATETGSDPSATFRLYRTRDGVCLWERRRESTPLLGVWDAEGRRLAFWGWGGSGTTVWVHDVAAVRFTKSLTKRDEHVLDGQVTGLDWSDRGDLVASTDDGPVEAVFVAPGGDPRAFVRLCGGRLPIWLDWAWLSFAQLGRPMPSRCQVRCGAVEFRPVSDQSEGASMAAVAASTRSTTVGAYEAKTHLPELLRRVEKGERITITKHGHPVAELVPASGERRRRVAESIAKLEEFRKGHTLDGMTIRQLIDEGRRH